MKEIFVSSSLLREKMLYFQVFGCPGLLKQSIIISLKKHNTMKILAIIIKHLFFSIYLAKILFVNRKKRKRKAK